MKIILAVLMMFGMAVSGWCERIIIADKDIIISSESTKPERWLMVWVEKNGKSDWGIYYNQEDLLWYYEKFIHKDCLIVRIFSILDEYEVGTVITEKYKLKKKER